MADVHDKATRSKNMRAIATRDTAIEKRLASVLAEEGVTFRVQDATLPGRPDFVVDDYRCVIFTHGCFWHHHNCYLFKVPTTRTAFWLEKIGKNVQRDARDCEKLQALGWRVLIVWECALRGREKLGRTRCPNASSSGSAAVATVRRSTPSVSIYCNVFSDGVATASALTGNRYLPSVTSTTANTITPSASHSMGARLSPPVPVPNSTATTGLT